MVTRNSVHLLHRIASGSRLWRMPRDLTIWRWLWINFRKLCIWRVSWRCAWRVFVHQWHKVVQCLPNDCTSDVIIKSSDARNLCMFWKCCWSRACWQLTRYEHTGKFCQVWIHSAPNRTRHCQLYVLLNVTRTLISITAHRVTMGVFFNLICPERDQV